MRKIIKILVVAIVLCNLFVAWSVYTVKVKSSPYITSVGDAPDFHTALVLGASVYSDWTLTPALENRAKTAVELYKNGTVKKILVTGDNGDVSYNEVNPVRKYLTKEGIPDSDIFLDHAGFDTYDSIYRAKYIFQVPSLLIVSQKFHLPRAVYMARSLGIDAYGVIADELSYGYKSDIREIFATAKGMLDLIFKSKPKYLGEKIPITETDGKTTWY